MTASRYIYQSNNTKPKQQRALKLGLRWLIKRFEAHMRLHEGLSDIVTSPEVISAIFLNLQKDGLETSLTAEGLEHQLGDSNIRGSGIRIKKFGELRRLQIIVTRTAPEEIPDTILDELYQLFHDLVLSTVYQMRTSRRQKAGVSFDLQADLHFYSQALAALGRNEDVLLLVGHAYPFDIIELA